MSKYRYELTRDLLIGDGIVVFVMLNPSTADAIYDDPTIRRCKALARSWGYRILRVVNLFNLRATDPKILLTPLYGGDCNCDECRMKWLVGPEGDAALRRSLVGAREVVVAWGSHQATRQANRVAQVYSAIREQRLEPRCLGRTKDYSPRHPLYVKGDTPLEPWGEDEFLRWRDFYVDQAVERADAAERKREDRKRRQEWSGA